MHRVMLREACEVSPAVSTEDRPFPAAPLPSQVPKKTAFVHFCWVERLVKADTAAADVLRSSPRGAPCASLLLSAPSHPRSMRKRNSPPDAGDCSGAGSIMHQLEAYMCLQKNCAGAGRGGKTALRAFQT